MCIRDRLGNNIIRYIVVLLGFVMAIYVSITAEGDEELKPYFAKLRRYLAGYIPIVVFTTLWTAAFYDYSLDTILRVITPYSYIFLHTLLSLSSRGMAVLSDYLKSLQCSLLGF